MVMVCGEALPVITVGENKLLSHEVRVGFYHLSKMAVI